MGNYSSNSSTFHAEIMLPVIFRMHYCCGMRPGEPLRLRKDDVNLSDGDVHICETKNNRDRHIVMPDDKAVPKMLEKEQWVCRYSDKAI